MPLKPVVDIEVKDEKFREFLDLFNQYQETLKTLPADWGKVGAAAGDAGSSFDAMAAAMLAQTELLHRLNQEERQFERTTTGASRAMHGVAQGARDVARHVGDTTRHLLRWGSLAGIFGGVLGLGSLWGLERLTSNASALRTAASGLDVRPGTLLAARTNFGQFFNAQGVLSSIANLQNNLSGQVAFNTLGVPGAWNEQNGGALVSVLNRIHALYQRTPRGELQNMPWYQAAAQMGFSAQDIRVIGNMSGEELRRRESAYQRDREGNFGLQSGTLKAAQDVDRQLSRVGYMLEYTFLAALKPIMPELTHLSKALGSTVTEFLKGDGFNKAVNIVATSLGSFATFISGPEFKSDAKEFLTDIKAFATGLESVLKFFGLLPDKSGMTQYNAATGMYKGPHDWVWHPGKPPAGAKIAPPATATQPFEWYNPGSWLSGGHRPGTALWETPTINVNTDQNAAYITSQIGALGLNREQTAGLLSTLYGESKLNPNAKNPYSSATGIAQWVASGGRLQKLQAWAAAHHEDWHSLQAQTEFLVHEFQTDHSGALARLRSAKTPEEAARIALQYYEGVNPSNAAAASSGRAGWSAVLKEHQAMAHHFMEHLTRVANKTATGTRHVRAGSPQQVKISVDNNTGGSAVISASQLATVY